MNELGPITKKQYVDHFRIGGCEDIEFHKDTYLSLIDKIKDTAIAPYFWFIANAYSMTMEKVSENISQMTPFLEKDWLNATPEFFINLFHPDDRFYFLSSLTHGNDVYLGLSGADRANIKFLHYVRMLNADMDYRWVLFQMFVPFVNKNNQIESALTVVYDLSHLSILDRPLLSIIDLRSSKTEHYRYGDEQTKKALMKTPEITNREKDILLLMAQGYKTPDISQELHISYQTVENHKRNLRVKTNTKTSSELMVYVITHNLLKL